MTAALPRGVAATVDSQRSVGQLQRQSRRDGDGYKVATALSILPPPKL